MEAVQSFSRYGAIVGVFSEWHPYIYRIISAITPAGSHGLGYLAQVMNKAIDEEAAAEQKPNDLQQHLVSKLFAMHHQDPDNFTYNDIRFHIVPAIGGGSDTTASTIGAVIYYLCKNPSVNQKLQEELDKMSQTGRLTRPTKLKEAQQCSYLQMVLKETMRLFPGIGLPMPRVVPEGGLTLGGHFFPAGVSRLSRTLYYYAFLATSS